MFEENADGELIDEDDDLGHVDYITFFSFSNNSRWLRITITQTGVLEAIFLEG